MSKANASMFMTVKGLKEDMTEDRFKEEFMAYLKEDHRALVTDFAKKKKGLAIVFCNTWESASMIANTYKDKFMDYYVSFSLFCPNNPDQMV